MFIEKIKSEGLAHLSYLIGDQDEAAVIDPRRDCDIYVRMALDHDCRITDIFETHRNEDLVSGSPRLANITGARVHHGPNSAGDVVYAETVRDGERFKIGDLRLEVLETPGHTDDSISLAIYDENFGEHAVGVFTGDALFVGDVGRTDFYPDRASEVAGKLYDSLQKLFDLGGQAIIYPAHGAGSVCGDNMASREFSTLGYEHRNNPMASLGDRDEFISRKLAEHHGQPPYFRVMERLNLEREERGEQMLLRSQVLSMDDFEAACNETAVVDVRGVTGFLGAHTPNALCLPEDMVPAYAGWLLDPEQEITLVADGVEQARKSLHHLYRMGYDRVRGMMLTAIPGWAAGDRSFRNITGVNVEEVARRVERPTENWTLLDVRDPNEIEQGKIDGSTPIYLGELPDRIDRLDPENKVTVMCASGERATIGASILLREGFEEVDVFLGSMGAWLESGLDTVQNPD
ncbi:MAG: MBL fold metallo-hydrolase [Lysobacterales bacterium]